jgi:hypothetical protein
MPARFRKLLPELDIHTVDWAGIKGLKNGKLVAAGESAGYQALITGDAGIHNEQNWTGRSLSLLVLRAKTNNLENLRPLVPALARALAALEPGQIVHLS